MPELPEVETLRRDLSATIVGRRIEDAELRVEKLFRPFDRLAWEDLRARTIAGLRRRGKLLVWELSDDLALVTHLKLTGQVVHRAADGTVLAQGGHPVPAWGSPLPHKATHVTLRLDDGSVLYLTDIRQFARLWLFPAADAEAFIARQKLGPEPLTEAFDLRGFRAKLARRSVPIKTVLLDQRVVGGVGNIYADEALWAASIHPRRPADRLSRAEADRLMQAIQSVLRHAVENGVAIIPPAGAEPDASFPYCHGKAGWPCARCGSPIAKEVVGGRGTYSCPTCQRPPRARARAPRS